jgi:DNA modification methylase
MQTKRVPIESVSLDPANTRKHGARNLDAIKASLQAFGQQHPIIVDSRGIVLAGNGRLMAAKALGWTHIEIIQTELEGSEAVAFAIADNRTAELAEWDSEALATTLAALQNDEEFDHLVAGFTDAEIEALVNGAAGLVEVHEDDVPEPPAEPITKPGDLWVLGGHRLLCGDSTKAEDVARLMGGERADLCFTSPPYANQRTYTKEGDLSTEYLSRFIPAASVFVDVFCVNLGIARHGGRLIRYWDDYISAAEKSGLGLLSWNVWDRGAPKSIGQQTAMFPIEHEWILVFGDEPAELTPTVVNKTGGQKTSARVRQADGTLGDVRHSTKRIMRELGTIVRCNQVSSNADHPAQFPVELAAAYIRSFEGNIYEPFCGSGTTLIAAEQLGRKCYGIEISPAYCDVIVKRWENLTGNKAERNVQPQP